MRTTPRLSAALLLAFLTVAWPAAADHKTISEAGVGPRLSQGPDGTLVLSYLDTSEATPRLLFQRISAEGLGEPETVTSGGNWFINWADFPSVVPLSDNFWAAHWLVRQPAGGYAYDVFVALSEDDGKTWGEPFLLHYDDTPTEHGFVTLYRDGDNLGAIWLDGREMSAGHGHDSHGAGAMTIRSASIDADGRFQRSEVIDERTCECCDTDVAISSAGPVAVYRNRGEDETRDIYISRHLETGWTAPVAVHQDGWKINGCPVNGPSVVAQDSTVVVTWYTAANGAGSVKVAWSEDAGESFADPVVLDDMHPAGYVGSALLQNGAVIASWMCQRGDVHQVCYRVIEADGAMSPVRVFEDSMVASRMTIPQVAVQGETV